jgi:hypothetical protein
MLRGCAAAAIIDNRATEHCPPSYIKPNQPVAIIAMQKTRQRGAGGLRKLRVLGGKRSFMTLVHCSIKVYVSSGHTPQCSIRYHSSHPRIMRQQIPPPHTPSHGRCDRHNRCDVLISDVLIGVTS